MAIEAGFRSSFDDVHCLDGEEQVLRQELAFLRNLFRIVVQAGDTQDARDEIATRIQLVSTRLNDLVAFPVEA